MTKKLFLIFLLAPFIGYTQVINGPVVSGRFDQTFLMENFDAPNSTWPIVSNADNLLLIQDGELIIQRRNTVNPFAVFGSIENNLTEYRLVTSLKIVKSGQEGNLGLVFMAQSNGSGGFIFEINNRQEYRLRQITGSIYKILSGDLRNDGWVKSSLVLESGKANVVEIRTINRKYDILLNNKYLMSFSEMAYRSGNFGYVAGPSTKGVVDFLYIFQNESSNKTSTETPSSQVSNEDVIALSESIIALRTQINKLSAENEEMRTLIKAQRSEQEDVKSDKLYLQKQILELQHNIANLRQSNDSLLQVNKEFSGIKSGTGNSGDNDIIIVLSKNLKAEKQRNDELKNENLQLKKELDKLRGNGGN